MKAAALLPIPIVIVLVLWAGQRPLPLAARPSPMSPGGGATPPVLPVEPAAGWRMVGQVQRFDRKTLFDRINGAAPVYLRAGFVGSLGAEYSMAGVADPVQVDVYDMGAPERALGIYAAERDPSYRFLTIGAGGYAADGIVNFWQGQYYVKLAGYGEGAGFADALAALATGLARGLGADAAAAPLRARLARLPAAGRRAHEDGYSHAPLGTISGLHEALYATYGEGDARYRLFCVSARDAHDAAQRLSRARDHLQREGHEVREGDEGGAAVLHAVRQGGSSVLLVRRGASLAGAVDLPGERVEAERKRLLEVVGD